jgi:hypothetical protein
MYESDSDGTRSRSWWLIFCDALTANLNPSVVAALQPSTVFAFGIR